MSAIFKKLEEQLKASNKTIVLPDGPDPRILEASARLTADGILDVILVGTPEEFDAAAKETGFDISKCQIIDPKNYDDMDNMVKAMMELR